MPAFTDRAPSTTDPIRPRNRTLGEFLCKPDLEPPFIDVDQLPWQDIKQDACLRAIVALRRAGKPVGPDPIAAFDAEPRLVMTAYQRAYYDALRRHLGYGPGTSTYDRTWRHMLSLDHGLEELADRDHEVVFEQALEVITAGSKLILLMTKGVGGVKPKTMRKLLRVLRKVQRMKESGTYVIPAHTRAKLYRFRSTTYLALDTDLL